MPLVLTEVKKNVWQTKSRRIQSAIRSYLANRLDLDLYRLDASSANGDLDRVRYRNGYWTDHLFWLWLWTQQDEREIDSNGEVRRKIRKTPTNSVINC